MNRKTVFDAVRAARGGRGFTRDDIRAIDALLDRLGVDRLEALAGSRVGRRVSAAGKALIEKYEDDRLVAYLCPAKVWTISRGLTYYPDGRRVRAGDTITQAQSDEYYDLVLDRDFAAVVDRMLGSAPTTQGQFDAMVSLAWNVGTDDDIDDTVEGLGDSTLLRKHKAGDIAGAKAEFAKWNKSGGQVLRGLTKRRAEEAAIYGAAA